MQRKAFLGWLLAGALAAAFAGPASALDLEAGSTTFSIGGFVGVANAVRLSKPDSLLPISLTPREGKLFLLQQNQLRLRAAGSHPHNVSTQLTLDFLYSSQPGRPFDERAEAEIDEAYIDFATRGVYWRVGKEKVIWGKSDLISPFDILTAKDVKDPFVNETLYDRIGQWGVRADYSWSGHGLEMVYVPVWTRSQSPEARTLPDESNVIGLGVTEADEWFPPIGIYPTFGLPTDDPDFPLFLFVTTYNRNEKPKKDLSTGSFGAKLNWVTGRFDSDFYYVTALDPLPHPDPVSTFLTGTLEVEGQPINTILLNIDGSQEFSRVHVVGAASSTTWGRLAVREEVSVTQGGFWYRLFDEEQLNALVAEFNQFGASQLQDTATERTKFANIVGADYEIPGVKLFTSTQLLLAHGFGFKEVYFNKANEVSMTNAVRRSFLDNHLQLSFADLINFSGDSAWMRPAVSFTPPTFEDLELKVGINIFTGQEFSYVGQYKDNSSFTFTARLLF